MAITTISESLWTNQYPHGDYIQKGHEIEIFPKVQNPNTTAKLKITSKDIKFLS